MRKIRLLLLSALIALGLMISVSAVTLPTPRTVNTVKEVSTAPDRLYDAAYETYATPALTAFDLTYTNNATVSVDFGIVGNSPNLFFYAGLQSTGPNAQLLGYHQLRLSEVNSSPEDVGVYSVEFNLSEYNLTSGKYSIVYAIVNAQFQPVDENQQVITYFYSLDLTVVDNAIPISEVEVLTFDADGNPLVVESVHLCPEEYYDFAVSILPANASGNRVIECISSNPNVVAAYSYLGLACIEAVAPGSATVTVAVDGQFPQTFTVTVGHEFEYELIAETTCNTDGVEEFHCTLCGHTYTEITPAFGHEYGENQPIVVTENTATQKGKGYRHCNACNENINFEIPAVFIDTDPDSYYCEGIDFCYAHNITKGTGEDIFSPNVPVTRGMVVTFLYRFAGEPESNIEVPFTDVPEEHMFYDSIAWAYEKGITSGTDMNTFLPSQNITREQLATFLYRYIEYVGGDAPRADLSVFPDADLTATYAADAVSWAVGAGIISGTNYDGIVRLSPRDTASRAQTTTMILRVAKYIGTFS